MSADWLQALSLGPIRDTIRRHRECVDTDDEEQRRLSEFGDD